jgi:hypothetical protein
MLMVSFMAALDFNSGSRCTVAVMTTDLPIACSLSATELSVRQAQMAELGRDALLDATVDGRRAELRFAGRPGVRERVERFVAAEGECCAFLAMRVEQAPDQVRVTIDAPDGAELVLEELVAAFRPAPRAA